MTAVSVRPVRFAVLAGLMALLLTFSAPARAQEPVTLRAAAPDATAATLTQVAAGFTRPLYVTHAGDGSGRLFVMEQGGLIWVIADGERLPTPFIDLSALVSAEAVNAGGYTERGLLGLAFHPQFAENGLFFVNYTNQRGNSVVARYSISAQEANMADVNSAVILLQLEQPFPNHNGGHLAFGPDGYLYLAFGDGGSSGDPLGAGQNLNTLLGKILRIDVATSGDVPYTVPADNPFVGQSGALPEIWAYGVRNPWRFSFDRATGDQYIADVGQNTWEEVNFLPAGQGGANLGWNVYEGNHAFSGAAGSADMVMPIAEYRHTFGISVTGGYVYRGQAIADWQGVYVYGDFGSGILWGAYRNADGQWAADLLQDTGYTISSFGEDEAGELYLVDYNGAVYQFTPAG